MYLHKKTENALLRKKDFPANLLITYIIHLLFLTPFFFNREKKIIAAGRLDKIKGFDLLLKIWAKLESNYPEWILEIYGSGEEEKALEKIKSELKLQNVYLKGRSENICKCMKVSSIYAMTSSQEGFPLVLLEAETMGLPIVSFNCPHGPSEIVSHNKNGFLIEPNNLDDFADKLSLLIEDEQLREQFGKASFELSKRFNKEKIFTQWTELLNSL